LLVGSSLCGWWDNDCSSPPDAGYYEPGRPPMYIAAYGSYMWYYDRGADDCYEFWYNGNGGNNNRYSYKWYCNQVC
jgi:hypothetical protein